MFLACVRPASDRESGPRAGSPRARTAFRAAAIVVALLLLPAGSALAQPTPAPPGVIDGPSAGIVGLSGMSIARDGSGGLAYLKQVAGVPHVFVSRLIGGVFQTPQEVDATLAGASSQPVIAGGDGGVLLVAFINSGGLYIAQTGGPSTPFSPPAPIAGGASNPSLEMSNFGKAYLAFTVADGAGHDVRAAYYYQGRWALESAPLNAVPGDEAGTGSGRPAVAAAGDGVGIVVWGEGGRVYSRRVWGTSPSIVFGQADGPLPGCTEGSADDPVVGAGGDSSWVGVAFHEVLRCGSVQEQRVLMNRWQGSIYDGLTQPDGLGSSAADGADQPEILMNEYGRGYVTSARITSHLLFGTVLGTDGGSGGLLLADDSGLPQASPPFGVPAAAGLSSEMIAWQQDPGTAGLPEIRLRYAPGGGPLGPDVVLSAPAQGPTAAANGLAAGGDVAGDAAVAWVQGSGAASLIVADQLYQPPGSASPVHASAYARTLQPRLAWSPAPARWGPLRYLVSVDGAPVAQTLATSLTAPAPLTNGRHSWRVTAINPAGVQHTGESGSVFVDTVRPTVRFSLSGKRQVGASLHVYVSARDLPPLGLPAAAASGIASVTLKWGDRTIVPLKPGQHRSAHAYRRAGRYRITVVAVDRAGNSTTAILRIKLTPPPPAPPKRPPARRKGT